MTEKEDKSSDGVIDTTLDGNLISNKVFQRIVDKVGAPTHSDIKSKHNLFVLAGPTGAGKSTVYEMLEAFAPRIGHISKDNTRPIRDVVDKGHRFVSKTQFKKRHKTGAYIHTYETNYNDGSGDSKRVQYGIPKGDMLDLLKRGDAVLTLTDPKSYVDFLGDDRIRSSVEERANIIPVIITTETPEDLKNRLWTRQCDDKERQRRLMQATIQWEEFNKYLKDVAHVIINNTPQSLQDILSQLSDGKSMPDNEKIPKEIVTATYSTIDDTVRKFAGIVNFYRDMRMSPSHAGSTDLVNVHHSFIDWVCKSFFGVDYDTVRNEISGGKAISLTQSAELIEKVKQRTGKAAQVDHIFNNLVAVGLTENEGRSLINFNDVLHGSGQEAGREIFKNILPEYGHWVDNDTTRRYSLTDKNISYSDIYGIDMKIAK
jgi:guanylate kinase